MDTKSKIFLLMFCALIVISVSAAYYRFMIIHDYIVAYESECDPYTQVCFIGCEDDECTSEYYYSQVEKYAPNVFEQCGKDISDCENAYTCLPEDGVECSVTFCSPEIDGDSCEELTEKDYIEENDSVENSDSVIEDEEVPPQEVESAVEEHNEDYSDKTNEIIENL